MSFSRLVQQNPESCNGQFYRKLKPITEKSPADIIKEYRLTVAERLLLTKNLTIEEIMDKTGFTNRGTFYKVFSLRFGMPPDNVKGERAVNLEAGEHILELLLLRSSK